MRRLRHLPDAIDDLDSLWLYIAQDDPAAAERLIAEIDQITYRLCEYPYLGPAKPHVAQGMRSFTVESYRILYRVTPDTIDIVRVVHHARDLRRLGLPP